MIAGIGTDLCRVGRIAASIARPGFLARVFSAEERALLDSLGPNRRVETAAANFAAKEAFLKAAGTGLGGFALADIAVLRQNSGAPYFAFSGQAAQWMRDNRLTAHVSLTHENGLAAAFVVLEGDANEKIPACD